MKLTLIPPPALQVAAGDADGMVSGACHSTAQTIRPGLQTMRDPDNPLVSSIFFMCLPDKASCCSIACFGFSLLFNRSIQL